MRAFIALVVAVLLAGCLGGVTPPAGRHGVPGEDALIFLAFEDEGGSAARVFHVNVAGDAFRLRVLLDDSRVLRAPPGLGISGTMLSRLGDTFGRGGVALGGVVHEVERGAVPGASLDTLWAQLDGPRVHDTVLVGASILYAHVASHEEPRVWGGGGIGDSAFARAEAAFAVAARDSAPLPWVGETPPCARLASAVDRDSVGPGDRVTIRATITNCDAEALRLGGLHCGGRHAILAALVPERGLPWLLSPGTAARAAYAIDLVCRDDERDTLEVPPGEDAHMTWVWDGLLRVCVVDAFCVDRAAPAGAYGVILGFSGQPTAPVAEVQVVAPEPPRRPVLLIQEAAELRSEGQRGLHADFGPACARVAYNWRPLEAALRHRDAEVPEAPRGLVVRDFRAHPAPPGAITPSPGRLILERLDHDSVALKSPFDRSHTLLEIRLDDEDFLASNERVRRGESLRLEFAHDVEAGGERFETTSLLLLTNLGPVPIETQRIEDCP